jgi:hypothetical protein
MIPRFWRIDKAWNFKEIPENRDKIFLTGSGPIEPSWRKIKFMRGRAFFGDEAMLRKFGVVALGLLLSSGIALAQPSSSYRTPDRVSDEDSPPPPDQPSDADAPPPPGAQADADQYRRDDLFCRRDAAARTGYVSPGQAARNEQARGTIGGTALGAAAGAIIGAAGGHAGTGAAIGAGAGLLAGTAVGADNASRAADAVQRRYAAAYYDCMAARDGPPDSDDEDADAPPPPGSRYGYGYGDAPPPPPPAYYGYPYYPPYYYYPPPYYYGPGITFGFGFGGGHGHWHHH